MVLGSSAARQRWRNLLRSTGVPPAPLLGGLAGGGAAPAPPGSWCSPGTLGLLVRLLLHFSHSQKSPVEGSLGFLALSLQLLSKQNKTKNGGHVVSPPILSQNPPCGSSNKLPLPHTPLGSLPFDAIGPRPGFFKPSRPGSSLLKPDIGYFHRAYHPVSLLFIYFRLTPSNASRGHFRAKAQGANLWFSISFLHSFLPLAPSQVPGET